MAQTGLGTGLFPKDLGALRTKRGAERAARGLRGGMTRITKIVMSGSVMLLKIPLDSRNQAKAICGYWAAY
jgi:hypothetical protein